MLKRILVVLLASGSVLCAGESAGQNQDHAGNRAAAHKIHQDNLKKHEGKSDFLVLPGLVADKSARSVAVLAESTTLEAGGILEFLLISERSGHDYEAFAMSFAKPSDIVKALGFIGLQPGTPADENALRFWPKGERVTANCVVLKDGVEDGAPIRLEKVIKNTRTEKPTPENGLVFVGSKMVDSRETPGQKVLAADEQEPNTIASTYNDSTTVFDVPRQAPQKTIYGQNVRNPDVKVPTNCLIKIVFEPEYKETRKRVRELQLSIAPKAGTAGLKMDELEFKVTSEDGKTLGRNTALNTALETFNNLIEKGCDPFVTFVPDGRLTLKAIHDCYGILGQIESDRGIRIEPPVKGSLYYRAFLPPDSFRDRASRGGQPWELKLAVTNSKIEGVLTRIEEIYPDDKPDVELKPHDYPVDSPQSLCEELAKHPEVKFGVILAFAPPNLTHDQFMAFIAPSLKTHPKVHVYLQETAKEDAVKKEEANPEAAKQ